MSKLLVGRVVRAAIAPAVVALGLFAAIPVMAQSIEPSAAAGRWLYDSAGNTIGSVVGPAEDGRSAKIMIGSYFRPGSHQALVPADALQLTDGKVTLQAETLQALNLPPRR